MFDTFPLNPLLFRIADALFRVLRIFLVILGLFFVFGWVQLAVGNQTLSDRLRPLLAISPVASANASSMVENEAEEADETPLEALTPRMQAALDYASRRYRVSAQALQPIFAVAQESAQELHLDPLLIVAVIAIESRFNPLSESVMGAQGLMQVIPRFHQDKLPVDAGKLPLFDPEINVRVGARALQEYIRRNGGVTSGLQQFAGAAEDPEQAYAAKVLAEKERMETNVRRRHGSQA